MAKPIKARTTEPDPQPAAATKRMRTTGISLPDDTWALLNRVAFERARVRGGRASVSALLMDLVERHRKELEAELKGSLT